MGLLVATVLFVFLLNNYSSAVEYRLPETVVPTFYKLSLNINPENDDYTGIVNITLNALNQTKDVYLHSDTNFIEIGTIILNNNAKCYVTSLEDVDDIVMISCSRALIIDQDNSLYIEFTSKFSTEDGYGLYKSIYAEGQVIIESNFKPTYARRAFPCLDEPDFKAGFAVEITYPRAYTALSNSPAISTNKASDGDLQTTKFENTPEISTYLLSVLVSKLQEAKTSEEEGVDFKIFARSEVTSFTETVANTYYHKIIEKLDSYTGVPYQNLSDTESYLVALPEYSDAMGDFGLFTYRETDLLDEGDKTTAKVKQDIITTMAYKLSHEWYGGDVATTWWSDIWANEAVATYLKYVIPAKVDDELELTNQFLLEVTQKMLRDDAYSFAQPLSSKESNVDNEWAIENKLNTETSEKGASILHMINYVLKGDDNFQSALQDHFANRKDAETDGSDILKDLLDGKGDDKDYYAYFENWVFSAGYPLLTVMLDEVKNTTSIANLTQKRFVYPTSEAMVLDSSVWNIPVTTVTLWNHPTDFRVDGFLEPDQEAYYFFGDTWILFNGRGGCFYRVNYDEPLWRRILDGLNSNRSDFLVLERAQLIDDIFNIARIGDVSYSMAFEMADSLADETDYYPWYSAINAFSYLLGKMKNKEVESNLKNYILRLMDNVIVIPNETFVEDDDNHISVLKKVMILNWACNLGHTDCISYATNMFNSYIKAQDSLSDYNARGIIFCNGIRHSGNTQQDWDFLWNIYNESSSVHEQSDILNALGCAEDKDILQTYLEKIITVNSGIKKQDALVVFKSVFSSSVGLQAAVDFLDNNLSGIKNFFADMIITSEMIYIVAENLITDDQIEWLKNLLSAEILNDYEDVKSKANTLASVNNYWQKNFQDDVTQLFPPALTTEPAPSSSTETDYTSSEVNTEVTTTEPSTTTDSGSNRIAISISIHTLLFLIVTLKTLN